MMVFETSWKILIFFGFNPITSKPDPNGIWWNDPKTGEWEAKADNMAGNITLSEPFHPKFVRQYNSHIVAWSPEYAVELTFSGIPWIFNYRLLKPENASVGEIVQPSETGLPNWQKN